MIQIQTKYHQIFFLLLVMLVAIPCAIKKDLKRQIGWEVNHSLTGAKTTCSAVCSLQIKNEIQRELNIQPSFINQNFEFDSGTFIVFSGNSQLNFHKIHRTKIPTHILHQQFRI